MVVDWNVIKKLMIQLIINFILLFSCFFLQASNVQEILKDIPLDDRLDIESLFHYLIKSEHFAYSLFSDKPMALSGDFTLTPWENTIEGLESGGLFWRKWLVWEKYKYLFPLKNYILIKEESKNKNYKISHVFLINKKEFIKIGYHHLRLFEQIMNRKFNPELVLKDIESGKISLMDSLNESQILLGTLLGYGVHNARMYEKTSHKVHHAEIKSMITGGNGIHQIKPVGEYGYSPLLIGSVHFSADIQNSETKALLEKYKKLRGKLSAIYAQGDFLEITLSQLISDDPIVISE